MVQARRSRLAIFAIIAVAAIIAIADYEQISGASSQSEASYAARRLTSRAVEDFFREESSVRAYTSTRDLHYLEPFHASDALLREDMSQLQSLLATADLNYATAYLNDISRVHEQWHASVAQPLLAHPSGEMASTEQRTGELLLSTADNDATFLEQILDDETARAQLKQRISVKVAIAEIAVMGLLLGGIVLGLQRASRRVETQYFEELAEANANLNKAQQLAGVGTWTKDLRTGKLAWSDELCRLFGVDDDEVSDDLLRSFDHPEDAAAVRKAILSAKEEGRPYNLEHRIVRRGGSIRHVQEQGEVVTGAGGQPLKAIGTIIDTTDRKQAEEILAHLAQHDALTGLPNRGLLNERLGQSIEFARRQNRAVAALYIDVDRFKVVNDSLGHAAGDSLLVSISERLLRGVRGCDTVARLGGDEFVVVLADMHDEHDVRQLAEKMLARFSEPFVADGREIFVSASIGVSTFPNDGDDVSELLEHADAAMYQAKDRGRANVQYYTADLHLQNTRKLSLEQDMRKGLERGDFVLHFQPIVAVRGGMVTGFEALVRWQHPTQGLLLPNEFIPAAEESGLIGPLGDWVLTEAVSRQAEWLRRGYRCGRMTVNISARQFQQRDFKNAIAACLAGQGVQPGELELELTESLVMRDVGSSLRTLHELKAMGVAVGLDDFGTGYSSLNYLKRFPIDTLKIDRSFISGITEGSFDVAICEAVITLARSLGVRVVAEGVETGAQLMKLRQLGCDEAQGYLFSPAAAPDVAVRLMTEAFSRHG